MVVWSIYLLPSRRESQCTCTAYCYLQNLSPLILDRLLRSVSCSLPVSFACKGITQVSGARCRVHASVCAIMQPTSASKSRCT